VSPGSRVFVVDDEPVIASSLAAILRMNGFSARFFTSPLAALAAARSESPDLVISDVAMPDISGIELAIQMRAQYPARFGTGRHFGSTGRGPCARLRFPPTREARFSFELLAEIGQLSA
jgi:CheY-like chemotaxis protein